jgi:hypothetical protein
VHELVSEGRLATYAHGSLDRLGAGLARQAHDHSSVRRLRLKRKSHGGARLHIDPYLGKAGNPTRLTCTAVDAWTRDLET